MANLTREALQHRLGVLETARRRADERYELMIDRAKTQLAILDAPEREPAPAPAPTLTRAEAVELPSPSTPPDAPSLEGAPELQRYVPTPEVLALTEPADVLTALGKLETPREEHELLSAWTVAGNRAALNAVAVHVGGPLGERAARSLKRLGPSEPTDTNANRGEA